MAEEFDRKAFVQDLRKGVEDWNAEAVTDSNSPGQKFVPVPNYAADEMVRVMENLPMLEDPVLRKWMSHTADDRDLEFEWSFSDGSTLILAIDPKDGRRNSDSVRIIWLPGDDGKASSAKTEGFGKDLTPIYEFFKQHMNPEDLERPHFHMDTVDEQRKLFKALNPEPDFKKALEIVQASDCPKQIVNAQFLTEDGLSDRFLHYSVSDRPGALEFMRALLENQADPHLTGKKKRTPLHLACISGNENAARELIVAMHGEMEALDDDGFTALQYAEKNGSVEIANAIKIARTVKNAG